jgi:hypothetical protein
VKSLTDRIKAAFDGVHAETALKESTVAFLMAETQKGRSPAVFLPVKRLAALCAAVLLFAMAGLHAYFSEAAYIDFDVNPSLELAVNRFDRVIGAYAYNADGAAILDGVDLGNMRYDVAIGLLFDELAEDGYLADDGLVSVTLQASNGALEVQLLPGLTEHVETSLSRHHDSVAVEIYPVSGEVRNAAHELNLSPAKYLAILELQEVDSTASVESCRNHSIPELRGYAQQHGGGHHGMGGGAGNGGQHRGGRGMGHAS